MKKINILQVAGSMDRGGTEAFLMNVFRNINRERFNFVFLCFGDKKFDYEEEVALLGGKIIRVAHIKDIGTIKYIARIKNVIARENIDIVHAHTYYNSMFSMIAAKLSGVKVRITHSHFTESGPSQSVLKKIYNKVAEIIIRKYSTNYLACGDEAGKSLFPKNKFTIVHNGIILEDYYLNINSRTSLRQSLNISQDSIVIGHVGRFDQQKNHKFLIEVFEEYLKLNPNSYLMLIGAGMLEEKIRSQVKKMGIQKNILFLGKRSDVNKLYNAMDIFLLPSLYEGLPVTLIETQANGLASLVSNTIDKSVKLTPCVQFAPLNQSPKQWAKQVTKMKLDHINTKEIMESSNYNIAQNVNKIEHLYMNMLNRDQIK